LAAERALGQGGEALTFRQSSDDP